MRLPVLLFTIGLAACGSSSQPKAFGSSTSDDTATATSAAQLPSLETWNEYAKGGPMTESDASLGEVAGSPCTTLDIAGVGHAALWPRGSSRTADGVVVDGHLFRFGERSKFRGREYLAPQTTTACVAARLWIVVGPA
jgi:hypothetical protein